MSASYPASVRVFSPKQDATMFILAAHVNDLQDEVAAIEQTVGVNPTEWDNGTTVVQLYPTIKARLDDAQNTVTVVQGQIAGILTQLTAIGPLQTAVSALQSQVSTIQSQISSINGTLSAMQNQISSDESRIGNLEGSTGGIPGQIAALQQQMAALQTGAAASIVNTGQVIVPDPYQWRILNWSAVNYDNVGIYNGGSTLLCPSTGWWIINLYGIFGNPSGGATGNFCEASLSLRINGNEVTSTSDSIELGIGGAFRMNVPWAGPWYQSDAVTAAVIFNPWEGSNPSISALISFTRLHGL